MNHPDDGEFYEIADEIEKAIEAGAVCFQKFTCLACRSRQTMAEPNTLYGRGECAECGYVTNLVAEGCGFMLIHASGDPATQAAMVSLVIESLENSKPLNRN